MSTLTTAFCPLWRLVSRYPLLLAVAALLQAFAWGGLLDGFDAVHVVWAESPVTGILNGVGFAFIFAGVCLSVLELDDQRGDPLPGWAYAATWGLFLVAMDLPALARGDLFRPDAAVAAFPGIGRVANARWWFPIGSAVAAAVIGLSRWALPNLWSNPRRLAVWVLRVVALGFVVMMAIHVVWANVYCPIYTASVSILLLVGLATALLWWLMSLAGKSRWLYPALILIAVIPFFTPLETEFRVPNMEIAAGTSHPKSYYDQRVPLWDYQGKLRNRKDSPALPDVAALDAWHERMIGLYGSPQPVVVVAVSGGASAAALYVADVLLTLEEKYPGFSDRIRVVSGASGGMLGAAYFVTQLRPGGLIAEARTGPIRAWVTATRDYEGGKLTPDAYQAKKTEYEKEIAVLRNKLLAGLERDYLSPIVQHWVHKDGPLGLVPLPTTNDRGAALEHAWSVHLGGALDLPFSDLRGEEKAATIPSLIFSPLIVEDGRQLLISNLNLEYMSDTDPDQAKTNLDPDRRITSHQALEFSKLFPHADGFKLSTAVRLNASFPFFSPAASLPTNPRRHVVDAGYYDNYGTTVATRWIVHNTPWFVGKFLPAKEFAGKKPEVILLQIRCFDFEQKSRQFTNPSEDDAHARHPDRVVNTERGMYTVTAPVSGLFAAWRANMVYRGDERVAAARKLLDEKGITLSRYLVECQVDPSLNWVLTTQTIAKLRTDADHELGRVLDISTFMTDRAPKPPPAKMPGDWVQAAKDVKAEPGAAAKPTKAVVKRLPQFQQAPNSVQQSIESRADLADTLNQLKPADPAKLAGEKK